MMENNEKKIVENDHHKPTWVQWDHFMKLLNSKLKEKLLFTCIPPKKSSFKHHSCSLAYDSKTSFRSVFIES